jgi:PPIC-type PPIASE domain
MAATKFIRISHNNNNNGHGPTPHILLLLVWALTILQPSHAFLNDAIQKIQKDFAALTRRVTARHILVSNDQVAAALKTKIRTECIEKQRYIVDVFEEAAVKYSQDETTNFRGGLLGTLVPQGHCSTCPTLDRACFEVSLGQVVGPLESEYGHHLVLVTERTNCPKLDGDKTLLMQTRGDDVFGTLVIPPQSKDNVLPNPAQMMLDQLAFWFAVLIAGGFVAELAEKIVR